MTFLNPLFLLGLAAAAIPLIIHLFNFRRPKRVNFSSLAFLHELRKSTMQRVRVKQWLLLALRTLAIASLVLAFARPTMTGPLAARLGGAGRTTAAVVLDRSASMTLRDGGGAYIDQARSLVEGLVGQMESGDEVLLAPVPASDDRATFHQHAAAI
ncbi:MAG: BatA domain-containing protein, partial [Bacteroidetes bacterium]|nr:BatA domain-containing protein [Bacteroidota bacterium]